MIAIRANQENLVHQQQNVATAKPLNQGVRGLAPKTPGNKAPKTPFRVPLNDENAGGLTGKNGLKQNGKGLATGKKNAFVTPGPAIRTALGNKTTNAKARNFATPAQKKGEVSPTKTQQQQKTGSPRLRRAKVKVHQEEAEVVQNDEEEADIERMPPRVQPLPDYPSDDDFGPNKEFPQLRPENFMRGWAELGLEPVDENGMNHGDRVRAARSAKIKQENEIKMQKSLEATFAEIDNDVLEDLGLTKKPKPVVKAPGTLRSQSAVSALATAQSRQVGSSNAAKGHHAAMNVRKSRQPAPPGPSARFANATAASRSTLGYAQGRAIIQQVRKPVAAVFRDAGAREPPTTNKGSNTATSNSNPPLASKSPAETALSKLTLQDLIAAKEDESDAHLFSPHDSDDDDVFQLPMPEE